MARQHYESAQDRTNEFMIKVELQKYFGGIKLHKLPESYRLDYAGESHGDIVAWFEVKRRKMVFGQYPDVFLSLHKVMHGEQLMKTTGLPFYFVVGMNDGTYVYEYKSMENLRLSYTGRTSQTRDSADIEPVVHFPMSGFTKI